MNKKVIDAVVIFFITISVALGVFIFLESKDTKNNKDNPVNNETSNISKEEKIDYRDYYYAEEVNIE